MFDMMWNDVCPCSDFPSHTQFIMCLKLCLFIVCLVIFGICQGYYNVGSVKLIVVYSQVLIYLKYLTASCSFVISSQLIWVKLCTLVTNMNRIMHNMLFVVFIQEYKLMCFQTLHKLWSLFFLGTFYVRSFKLHLTVTAPELYTYTPVLVIFTHGRKTTENHYFLMSCFKERKVASGDFYIIFPWFGSLCVIHLWKRFFFFAEATLWLNNLWLLHWKETKE